MSERPEGCALVTGASRGIGAATALMLAADGWPVRVNYRSDEAGAKEVVAVALYTPTGSPVSPCGACRQVIAEFGAAEVMSSCDGAATRRWSAAELLPDGFGLKARD